MLRWASCIVNVNNCDQDAKVVKDAGLRSDSCVRLR